MAAQPNKTKIPVGTVLAGKYRITREIGRGGMAAVYEAENVDIGKRVAIKVLAHELSASTIVVERFLREARAAAAIHSPYICDVYDSGRLTDGPPFLVLELLQGESLYERMTKVRQFDAETTVIIAAQTCRGLTKAHAASIVHRDLKPENIFLTRDEEGQLLAKILDFGLAKFYAPLEGGKQQQRLTREGAVFGTPAYMSPEQVRGQGGVDHRADLWALGCIVFECLTGRTVWSTEQGVAMTFAQIASAPLPRPAELRPDLPPAFTAWFDRALNRDINQRFQTAKELADELGAALLSPSKASFHVAVQGLAPVPPPSSSQATRPYPEGAPNPFLPSLQQPPPSSQPPPSPFHAQPAPSPFQPPQAPSPFQAPTPFQAPPPDPWMASTPPFHTETPVPGGAPTLGAPTPSALGFSSGGAVDARFGGRRSRSFLIAAAIGAGALLVAGAFYVGWTQLIAPGDGPASPGSAASSASASPSSSMDASVNKPPPAPPSPLMPWVGQVLEAQQAIASGDLRAAAELLKKAQSASGHGLPRTLLEHLGAAPPDPKAPCHITGLGRPRSYDLVSSQVKPVPAGRPAIALGPRGPVVTWTDIHEGAEHAYTVALDAALRDAIDPVDVTPESTQVTRPELLVAGEKLILSYSDMRGPEAGVHLRMLNGEGRIDGSPVAVLAQPHGGSFWPSVARAPDESIFVAWIDDGDLDSEDVFTRRLGPKLDPQGPPARLTDLAGAGKSRARAPSIAVAGGALLVTFRQERDPLRLIQQIRVPLDDATRGVDASKKPGIKADRSAGEMALANTDKAKGDAPSLACGAEGCFLTWHVEGGGAFAAFVDPARAQPLWRKKLSLRGGRPAVAVSSAGQAQVVWFENKQVLTASINREGLISAASRVARVSGDMPLPSIVAGAQPGEWLVAWQDYETGHLEAYAARFVCK
ncbi:MAG: protein kinase [Byssovorax sp.]